MLLIIFYILVAAVLLLASWWWLSFGNQERRRTRLLASRLPGPPTWPLLGNALVFINKPEDQLNIIGEMFEKYGEYVRFWLGSDLNVCIKNPADIRYVLTSNKMNHKGPLYQFLEPIIGPGILSGGPTWRQHRKLATPAYSKKAVAQYSQVFNEEAALLAQTLARRSPGVTFNVYEDVVRATTQCVCQTLMGLSKTDSKTVNRMEEVVFSTQTMYSFIFTKMTRWWLQIPLIFWVTGRKKTENFYIQLINDMTSDIVAKRREALRRHPEVDEETIGIVDRYILSGELSEQEIKWETFTLFTTSQEASAKIAAAVLLFLAHLPKWQEQVYNEIQDILGPEDDAVSYEQLKRLEALDMVFKEACRYLSIAAFIQRTVEEEISIKSGELIIPVGASVIIPIHMLHRDPQHWEDPHIVDPGRFEPENVKRRDPNAFVPFSLGAMDCLGRVYATSLIKTLVVHVVRQVELSAEGRLEDLDLNVAISVKFADGYNLRVRPRKQN
ncbi:cytochrome p450 domain-containing protein [Phthorimaea operculella]|nr:cytochrome p450 domain-containing protein [Phthorimaea operculella]